MQGRLLIDHPRPYDPVPIYYYISTMKKSMTVKKKKSVEKVTQHMGDVIEMNLEEVYGVKRAIFDLKSSRVELEIEEEAMEELSLVELNRAVIKTGWFDVLGIG